MTWFLPTPGPTLFVVASLGVLTNLGGWQLRRMASAHERLAEIEGRIYGPPLKNAGISAPPEELTWQKAELTGSYSGDPFLVHGRFEFGQPGFDILQAFRVDGGPSILVNRGWIPLEGWSAHLDGVLAQPPENPVRGLLLEVEDTRVGEPLPARPDSPERWPRESEWSMLQQADGLAPVLLTVGPELKKPSEKARSPYPITGYIAKPRQIPHFQYAMTWLLIAGTLIVVWVGLGISRARRSAA